MKLYYSAKNKLRSSWDYWRFVLRYRWVYLLGVLSTVAGMIGFCQSPPPLHKPLYFVFGVLSLGGVFAIFYDIRKWGDLYDKDISSSVLKSLKMSELYQCSGYKLVEWEGRYAYFSPDINRKLPHFALLVQLGGAPFSLSGQSRDFAVHALKRAFKAKAVLFNDPKVRLKSDMTSELFERGHVVLQKTNYYYGVCTSEMTLTEVWSRSKKIKLFDGINFISNNDFLLDLQLSGCSNHIGLSTLAFTKDGQLVTTVQARKSAQSPCLLAPSGSGSADYADLDREPEPRDFRRFLVNAMQREFLEECGLPQELNYKVQSSIVGFARLLHRGGKPEFFGISYIDLPSTELKVTNKEFEFIAAINNIQIGSADASQLLDALQRYRNGQERSFSILLHLNLLFLEQYVRDFWMDFQGLLKKPLGGEALLLMGLGNH